MKKINFFKISIIVIVIMLGGVACMQEPENIDVSSNSTSGTQSLETSSPMKATEPTEATTNTDKQIVEEIYSEIYKYSEKEAIEYADKAINQAKKLSNRYLGEIISKEDVEEKAEAVWIEIDKGQFEYIKDVHESANQPHIEATFYEKYDVWLVNTLIMGTKMSGERYAITGGFSSIIRNSDGEVLATW